MAPNHDIVLRFIGIVIICYSNMSLDRYRVCVIIINIYSNKIQILYIAVSRVESTRIGENSFLLEHRVREIFIKMRINK